nr:16S rRNA (cytosine(1407)-C(5))-methyltransferase RsmF [Dongshaea marina]
MPEGLDFNDFIESCQRPLRRSIRINTLKTDVASFLTHAKNKGWQLTPIPWCREGFWIERDEQDTMPLGNTSEYLSGLFYIQEASSMLPVSALTLDPAPNMERVLDAAAAPGSKTTQLAAVMNNQGLLVANEFSASRIKGLYSNVQRCGVTNVALTHFDASVFGGWLPEAFDAILLDAPCSGEGTIRKDPDALKNWSLEHLDEIASIQKKLIDSAFRALKAGGVMIYSTCTLNHRENQQVCQYLKDKYPEAVEFESLTHLFDDAQRAATPEGYLHVWPQIFDSEGFFIARIRKTTNVISHDLPVKRLGKFPFSPLPKKELEPLQSYLKSQFGIEMDKAGWYQRDQEIWRFPVAIEPLIGEIRFDRIGIKVAEKFKKGYRLTHEWAMAFGDRAERSVVELPRELAVEYCMGRDVRPQLDPGKAEVLVTYQGATLGLAKWVGNRLKNQLPRELVRDQNLF